MFQARVHKVLIASPGDVAKERQVVREAVHEWNSAHADKGIVLLPIGWEHDATPEMGEHPQDIINKQLLDETDLLVAIFWSRIGTKTQTAASGTVEEIERHVGEGKPAMVYFSKAHLRQDHNKEQFAELEKFKEDCKGKGLTHEYENADELRAVFATHLARKINTHDYFSSEDNGPDAQALANFLDQDQDSSPVWQNLTDEAKTILVVAGVEGGNGSVITRGGIGPFLLQASGRNLVDQPAGARTVAKWKAALQELEDNSLIEDQSYNGEVYQLTADGYEAADALIDAGFTPPE